MIKKVSSMFHDEKPPVLTVEKTVLVIAFLIVLAWALIKAGVL